MKRIFINEEKLPLIKEMQGEVTFKRFSDEVKGFISGLLDSPIGDIELSKFFPAHGIDKDGLLGKLLDRCIVKKKETFKEEPDEKGKKRSMHYVKYSVPRKDFERKMDRLFKELFECKINECDCGGAMGGCGGGGVSAGATNAAGVDPVGMGSGQYTTPLFGVQRRDIYAPARSREPGFSMKRTGSKKKKKNKKSKK